MKFKSIIRTVFLLQLLIFLTGSSAVDQRETASNERKASGRAVTPDNERILQQINYFSWIVNQIRTTKSPVVLEEIYDQINDNGINLSNIPDWEIRDLCTQIMREITDMRMEAKERKFWKEIRDFDKKNALWAACPAPSLILSPDWKSVAFNVATSFFAGIFRYRAIQAQIEREYKIKMHELDMGRLASLNDLNEKLFAKFWSLIQSHNIPDELRTARNECETLCHYIDNKSGNDANVYEYLCNNEKTYTYLQEYWFLRGMFAEKNKKFDDAEQAYKFYLAHHHQFLRKDKTTVKVALNLINLYLKNSQKSKHEEIKNLLTLVMNNITNEDFEISMTCGLIYLDFLNAPEMAVSPLSNAVVYLEDDFNKRYDEYTKLFSKNTDIDIADVPYPDCKELSFCRIALMRALCAAGRSEKALESYKNSTSGKSISSIEMYRIFKNTVPNQLPLELIADLSCYSIISRDNGDDYDVYLPLSWFINVENIPEKVQKNGVKVRMFFCNADDKTIEKVEEYKPLKNRYVTLFHCPFSGIAKKVDKSETIKAIKNNKTIEGRPMMHLLFNTSKSYKEMKKEGLAYVYLEISYDTFNLQLRYTENQSIYFLKSADKNSFDKYHADISTKTFENLFGISVEDVKGAVEKFAHETSKRVEKSKYPLEKNGRAYLPVAYSFLNTPPQNNKYYKLEIPEQNDKFSIKKEICDFYK